MVVTSLTSPTSFTEHAPMTPRTFAVSLLIAGSTFALLAQSEVPIASKFDVLSEAEMGRVEGRDTQLKYVNDLDVDNDCNNSQLGVSVLGDPLPLTDAQCTALQGKANGEACFNCSNELTITGYIDNKYEPDGR
jgi:hypothetical protein